MSPTGHFTDPWDCLWTHWTVCGHTELSTDPLDCLRTHWTICGPIGLSADTLDCLWTHWTVYGHTGLSVDPLDCLRMHWTVYGSTGLCRPIGLSIDPPHYLPSHQTCCRPAGLQDWLVDPLDCLWIYLLWTRWTVYGVRTHWTVCGPTGLSMDPVYRLEYGHTGLWVYWIAYRLGELSSLSELPIQPDCLRNQWTACGPIRLSMEWTCWTDQLDCLTVYASS